MIDFLFCWLRSRAIKVKQRKNPRNKQFMSFDKSKTALIVFDAQEKNMEKTLLSLRAFLQGKNISASFIGFCDNNTLPTFNLQGAPITVFNRKDLNWYGCLMDKLSVLSQNYDILIDICRKEHVYPLHYIVSVIPARMTIGRTAYPNNSYDMIIDLPKEATTQEYMDQVNHYLSTINQPQTAK
ncbi:MAG: DUF6913 domain-containing protein [Bacteroidales bacterium]